MNHLLTTYSIAAYDPVHQEWGVAVQSKFLAAGALVPWVEPNVGALATQGKTNADYRKKAFTLLKSGYDAREVIQLLVKEDSNSDYRQVGLVDFRGDSYAHTGEFCLPLAMHRQGVNYTCQGNLLTNETVLENMAGGFENTAGDLADKLWASLNSAQEAGGERRGVQSAAILVKKETPGLFGLSDSYIDIRVDDHAEPLQELKRLLSMHRVNYAMNHRNKQFAYDDIVKKMLENLLAVINQADLKINKGPQPGQAIIDFAREEGLSLDEVFNDKMISGWLVDSIVQRYYENEYKTYYFFNDNTR